MIFPLQLSQLVAGSIGVVVAAVHRAAQWDGLFAQNQVFDDGKRRPFFQKIELMHIQQLAFDQPQQQQRTVAAREVGQPLLEYFDGMDVTRHHASMEYAVVGIETFGL